MPFSPMPAQTGYCMDSQACKMKVEGKGSVYVQPDVAEIVLSVVTENMQLETAQQENAVKINQVINTILGLGIPKSDIQTQSYTISPEYDYVDGRQVFRGYRVVHSLKVTIRDIGIIGSVIDNAVKSGVNQINNISFTVSDPSLYYQQALNLAIDDATAKARTIGAKLNVAVSQVPVQIVESSSPPQPAPLMYQAASAGTQIQAGRIEISAQIDAIFLYS